jgi:acyl-CoA synthetase (AMP-forming)/AMP-acid ligase II
MGTDARPAIAFGPSLQPGPQTRATLTASIATRVADCPEGRLVSYGTNGARQSRTWVDLWDRAAGIAAALSAHGVTPGRPVVLLVADVLDFVPAFWGCLRAGGLAVPLTGAALEVLPERRNAALRDALARLARPVILTDGFFARLAEILAPADSPPVRLAAIPDAPCPWDDRAPAGPVCLVQTSGATGQAKLAALGQETLLNRQFSAGRIAVTQPVSVLSGFPLHSITGLRAAFLGYRDWVQLPPGQLAAAPFAMLDAVQACGVSRLFLSNGQAGDILAAEAGEAPRDLRTLRQVDFGGETVVPAILRRFRDLLARHGAPQAAIRAGYGTTETGPLAAGQDPLGGEPGVEDEAARLGGCAAGVALRITGTDGALLAEGDIGEVQALCPAVLFSGYWGEPGPIGLTADGWWPTGDLGCLRGGELTLHGRAKEVLVAHGKKYALAAIDAHLQAVLRVGVRAFACAVRWPEEASERLAVVVVLAARWRDHQEAITDEVAQASPAGPRWRRCCAPGRLDRRRPDPPRRRIRCPGRRQPRIRWRPRSPRPGVARSAGRPTPPIWHSIRPGPIR